MPASIPLLVRQNIYSYFNIYHLLNTISKLSTKDKKSLLGAGIMDQERILHVDIADQYFGNLSQLSYAIDLCTSMELKCTDYSKELINFAYYTLK